MPLKCEKCDNIARHFVFRDKEGKNGWVNITTGFCSEHKPDYPVTFITEKI